MLISKKIQIKVLKHKKKKKNNGGNNELIIITINVKIFRKIYNNGKSRI